MKLESLELMADGTPKLLAYLVGEDDSPTELFIDLLFYSEALTAGVYTLANKEKVWSFELPKEATDQGFPGFLPNAQLEIRGE